MPTYNGKATKLRSVTTGFRQEPALIVIPLKLEIERAQCAAPHAHPRGQLVYASQGIVRVLTQEGTWLTPPTQAVWIPPNIEHETTFPAKVTLYSLFVSPESCASMPSKCMVLKVDNLLREMIVRSLIWSDTYEIGDAGFRFMQVLLDEVSRAEPTEIQLPSAKDARLIQVTEALMEHPNPMPNLDRMADIACVSSRTLARLFVKETGLTLGEWNRRLLIHIALHQLNQGASVTAVAIELGYRNTSAFIEMFKTVLGVSPMRYMKVSGLSSH